MLPGGAYPVMVKTPEGMKMFPARPAEESKSPWQWAEPGKGGAVRLRLLEAVNDAAPLYAALMPYSLRCITLRARTCSAA